jgi:hypothetical protein
MLIIEFDSFRVKGEMFRWMKERGVPIWNLT